jgi:dipeptidyl aminopeptidase/acylaminoacyl peptidase
MIKRFAVVLLTQGLLYCAAASAEPFSAEILVRLDRVGAPALSPDGSKLVYSIRTTDMAANKGVSDLWWTGFSDGEAHQLTTHEANDTSPAWSPDGKTVYFLSARSGSSQVWRIALDDSEATQVTDFPVDVGTFKPVSGGDRLILSAEVYLDCEDLACTAKRDEEQKQSPTTGVSYEQLFMRHWDHWLNDKHSQLFILTLDEDGAGSGEPLLLSRGIRADIPSRVWGGSEEYTVSPDGSTVYFVARIRDRDEPTSTNFDLYSAPTNGDGEITNLTTANQAWDTQPVLSPDGQSLAYLAMSRPGFEADRFGIMIRDL